MLFFKYPMMGSSSRMLLDLAANQGTILTRAPVVSPVSRYTMDLTYFRLSFIGVFTIYYYIIESIYYIYKIRSDLEINDDFGTFWRY
ncbi:unnamed protein product [Brassica oleracea]|uniref:(rape) hypothetical protein n=1 Tax=Brassica napus TaxID=3708 RepID=A0A816IHV9_BRANA|nr:unnamed protein product [Brassica napus]